MCADLSAEAGRIFDSAKAKAEGAIHRAGTRECMTRQYFRFLIFCFLFLAGNAFPATAADYTLGGYVKSYFYLFQPPTVDGLTGTESGSNPEVMLSNRFRIQASYSLFRRMRLDAAYDLAPRMQSRGLLRDSFFFGRIDPFSYRAVDLDTNVHPSETEIPGRFTLGQNLDRTSLTLSFPMADIIIGRQAIAWGSARVINPTDVLAPFTFDTLDTEDRIGIDAVRTRIPIGTLSEIDVGYIFGKDFKFTNSAFFARTGFNTFRTDISLILMGFRENLLLGVDLARPIGGAGYWLETAYVFSGFFDEEYTETERDYFRASMGLDYNLSARMYGFLEYHYNGAGAALPGDYISRFSETAYTEGSVYLMGRHYLIPGLVYQYNPLVSFTVQSLINVTDPSLFLTPRMEYNISNNVYVSVGAFIGIGKGPVTPEPFIPIELRSEFGGYPNIYFTSLRYYF